MALSSRTLRSPCNSKKVSPHKADGALDEVIVTSFGITTRESFTGSADVVS